MARPLRYIVPNKRKWDHDESSQALADTHEVEVTDDANGNDDKHFKASNIDDADYDCAPGSDNSSDTVDSDNDDYEYDDEYEDEVEDNGADNDDYEYDDEYEDEVEDNGDEPEKVSEDEEQLDELKKSTLKSYLKKAYKRQDSPKADKAVWNPKRNKYARKFDNHERGIWSAEHRINLDTLPVKPTKYNFEETEVDGENQIDELSKKKLGDYIEKASHNAAEKSAAAGRYGERSRNHNIIAHRHAIAHDGDTSGSWGDVLASRDADKTADKFFNKSWKRRKGIAKAVGKLTNEEQINELRGKGKLPQMEKSLMYRNNYPSSKNPVATHYNQLQVDRAGDLSLALKNRNSEHQAFAKPADNNMWQKMLIKRAAEKGQVAKKLRSASGLAENEEQLDETMTRKHFKMVADTLKHITDPNKRRELANHHAEIFSRSNHRFNRSKFMSASGIDRETNDIAKRYEETQNESKQNHTMPWEPASAKWKEKDVKKVVHQGNKEKTQAKKKKLREMVERESVDTFVAEYIAESNQPPIYRIHVNDDGFRVWVCSNFNKGFTRTEDLFHTENDAHAFVKKLVLQSHKEYNDV